MEYSGNHITFIELEPTSKTKVWEVASKMDKETGEDTYESLGYVKWFGRWRRYAFFAISGTIFEENCLHEIAVFCNQRTFEHKSKNDSN